MILTEHTDRLEHVRIRNMCSSEHFKKKTKKINQKPRDDCATLVSSGVLVLGKCKAFQKPIRDTHSPMRESQTGASQTWKQTFPLHVCGALVMHTRSTT